MDRLNPLLTSTVFALLMLLLSGANAATPPAKLPYFSADYDASISGVAVKASRTFKAIDNETSELRFSARSFLASLDEVSQVVWEGERVKPLHFQHQRQLLGSERNKTLHFDWPQQTITSTSQDKTYTIANPQHALDHLSFQLQLQYDLLQGKSDGVYRIANKKRIKEYRFKVLGKETLSTPLGQLATVKIQVLRGQNKPRQTYLWLAENWHYLLVRLEQYEDDKKAFELALTGATVDQQRVVGRN